MKAVHYISALSAMSVLLSCFTGPAAAQLRITQSVFGSGGGSIESSTFRTVVTVGQPAAGTTASALHASGSGFWPVAEGISTVGIDDEEPSAELPRKYELEQNYPNPFNPSTRIRYALPEAAAVRIVVYDLLGREVAVLIDQEQPPGTHEVVWDGRGAAGSPVGSGLYLYLLETSDFVRTRAMTLIK